MMKIKDITLVALLLAIGAVLHQVSPPFFFGMRPDTLLAMFFVSLIVVKNNKIGFAAGVAAGLISALTTTFPGGQLANIIDKLVTTTVLLLLLSVLRNRLGQFSLSIVVAVIGTMVSGGAFLAAALFTVGLPAPFMALFTAVVLPATLFNAIATPAVVGMVSSSEKLINRKAA